MLSDTCVYMKCLSVCLLLSVEVKLHRLKILLKLLSVTCNSFPFHAFSNIFLPYLLLPTFSFGDGSKCNLGHKQREYIVLVSAAQYKCICERGKMQHGSIFAAFMHSVPMK